MKKDEFIIIQKLVMKQFTNSWENLSEWEKVAIFFGKAILPVSDF
jgi:hypothetical protein